MKGTLLWRYRVMLTSGALMLLSLHMVLTAGRPGDLASRPASVLFAVLSPIQGKTAELFGNWSGFIRDYVDLVNVRGENLRLKADLARITSERSRIAELETQNRHLSELLGLRDALALKAVGANVVGSDAAGLSRTVIIDQGSAAGIKPDMAVLSAQGVVGKIIAVGPRASRVLLIDDHNSALDAFDQRSRARGIIAGLVDDGLIMKYVDRSQDVKDGDTIVTSGLDGIFPRGLLVGTVRKVQRGGPGLFLNISVGAAADFSELEQVLVVTQTPPKPEGGAEVKG